MSERKFKYGDVVEVLSPAEILMTLDSNGTVDNLPFMPEMVQYCGKKYTISSRIEKTCVECLTSNNSMSGTMREFTLNDVVFLEELRCKGDFHENCQVGCMIFWKEKWLKRSNRSLKSSAITEKDSEELLKRLKTKSSTNRYICQSSQLASATIPITIQRRFIKLIREIFGGNIKVYTGLQSIINPLIRKFRKYRSRVIKGHLNSTPSEVLNLQPGEIVEVKPLSEILETLNKKGQNKGLEFNYGMKEFCGKRLRVRNRLDKIINESTGEMLEIKNTVILENATCTYDYKGFGCPRLRFRFWREIWLRRID